MTSFSLRNTDPGKSKADALVVGVIKGADGPELVPGAESVAKAWGRKFTPMLSALGVSGKALEVAKIPTAGTISAPLLLLVGLGEGEVTTKAVRRAAGTVARALPNAASVALAFGADSPALVRAVTEGWLLGGYTFDSYKSDTKSAPTTPAEVVIFSEVARKKEAIAAFETAEVIAEAVLGTRDWINQPPGDFTPPRFADAVTEAHRALTKGRGAPKVELTVYDEQQLLELGCGGILGVGAASSAPPRLVELRYAPANASHHIALVGKGITFDSGGLWIKPSTSMTTMKSDMSGAAAVIWATLAIAKLGLPVAVTTFAPMAENMLSGSAMRPGDILTAANGTTVEVINTDAEGRLVLMDALARAVDAKPDRIIDVATLTGAMVMALGDTVAGVMGSDEELITSLIQSGAAAGEDYWHMPIPADMEERIRSSKIADLTHFDGVRWGGGLFAAAFLREFTGGLPWAHLDIAGPAFRTAAASGHLTPGGVGFAVATLVDYARGLIE